MSKQEFLARLRKGLSVLPREDIEQRLIFYSEMIEDRMEEGLSEEETVFAAGNVDEIIAQVVAETSFGKPASKTVEPKRRLGAGTIVLLAIGSPLWLSLAVAAAAVVLSLYISLWAVTISLWSVFASLAACSVGGAAACVVFFAGGNGASGAFVLAAGMVCAGLAVFMFYGCKAATDGMIILTKKTAIWVKNRFAGKEAAQ